MDASGFCNFIPSGFFCVSCVSCGDTCECDDSDASNYNALATNNFECIYDMEGEGGGGCMTPGASNFDESATFDDYSCEWSFEEDMLLCEGSRPPSTMCFGCILKSTGECYERNNMDTCFSSDEPMVMCYEFFGDSDRLAHHGRRLHEGMPAPAPAPPGQGGGDGWSLEAGNCSGNDASPDGGAGGWTLVTCKDLCNDDGASK